MNKKQMNYKRFEMYLGWTCNNNCIFCVEMPTMKKVWNKRVTESEILKKLIKFRKRGYNHVTYLGGEPFIQKNFSFALRLGKKMGYTIMVTTNASMIQYSKIAKEYLPYIDQLVISIPIIDEKLQLIINDTKAIIDFDDVFKNIKLYWQGNFLKVNVVLNPYNIDYIYGIVDFLNKYSVKELSLTYPDINMDDYSAKDISNNMILDYNLVVKKIKPAFDLAIANGIRIKVTDIPFCFLYDESRIKHTDDYDYQGRTKIMYDEKEFVRNGVDEINNDIDGFIYKRNDSGLDEQMIPRMRINVDECKGCRYIGKCWGIAESYKKFFPNSIIKAIK